MTSVDTLGRPTGTLSLARSWDIVLIGIAVYALLACGLMQGTTVYPYGQNLYDEYFLAILDGHLDLPPRVAQLEGHYTPDGVAYLYHGMAPLLPRFVFGWIWPFQSWSLAPLSIWIWSCLGTLCVHAAFLQAGRPGFAQLGDRGIQIGRLLGIAIWFGGPGILLVANASFFHEPVALAYAATGGFVLIWACFAFAGWPLGRLALPCALIAAVTLHARPNVAVGLYLTTVLLLMWLARSSFKRHWLRIGLALLILAVSGFGFLALNSARFGSLTQTHGSFSQGESQYGFVYWGAEDPDSERATAFVKHGKFNAGRVPHNLLVYTLDLPEPGPYLDAARERLHTFARDVLAADLGFIRIEAPHAGLVFLWPLWLLLMVFAPAAPGGALRRMTLPLAGAAVMAALTLSYGTVTLRYRVDLWPFIALPALLGLSALLPQYAANPRNGLLKWSVAGCFLLGLLVTAFSVSQLRFFQTGSEFKPSWSLEECTFLARTKSFSQADIDRICRAPRIGG